MTKRVKFQEKSEIKNERPKTGIYRVQSAGGRTRRVGSGRRKGKACLQLYSRISRWVGRRSGNETGSGFGTVNSTK